MSRRVGSLKLKLKDVARLGQLAGADIKLLESQIEDPTSIGAIFKSKDRLINILDDLRTMTASQVGNAASARGFIPSGGNQSTTEYVKSKTSQKNSWLLPQASATSTDPNISEYAKQHGIDYGMASSILTKRGYATRKR